MKKSIITSNKSQKRLGNSDYTNRCCQSSQGHDPKYFKKIKDSFDNILSIEYDIFLDQTIKNVREKSYQTTDE